MEQWVQHIQTYNTHRHTHTFHVVYFVHVYGTHPGSVMDKQASWQIAVGPEQTATLKCYSGFSDLCSSTSHVNFKPRLDIKSGLFSVFSVCCKSQILFVAVNIQ